MHFFGLFNRHTEPSLPPPPVLRPPSDGPAGAKTVGLSDGVTVTGGPGRTPEEALVIHGADDEMIGVGAEYEYVALCLGQPNVDWRLHFQALMHKGGRSYDCLEVALPDGSRRTFWFDITEFFGLH